MRNPVDMAPMVESLSQWPITVWPMFDWQPRSAPQVSGLAPIHYRYLNTSAHFWQWAIIGDQAKKIYIKRWFACCFGCTSLVPHLIGPLLIGPQIHVPHYIIWTHWSPFSLVPLFISPSILGQSQWSPISLVPQCNPGYTVLIGPPSHWSPSLTLSTLFSLVPHLIGPPMRPWLHSSHWSPISLVPQSNPFYTVLTGPPSQWSPNATLITQFSLVPHLIGPPM